MSIFGICFILKGLNTLKNMVSKVLKKAPGLHRTVYNPRDYRQCRQAAVKNFNYLLKISYIV